MEMMYPRIDAPTTFKFPEDRLLKLRGIIQEPEILEPGTKVDHADDKCLLVIKSDAATGVTIGRATGIFSYIRSNPYDGTSWRSREWAIFAYDKNSGAFSARGNSGAIIVDGCGRIGGLLTAGCGSMDTTDITYATPFFFGFGSASRTIGFLTPTSTQTRPKCHDIGQNNIGDATEAVGGAVLFPLLLRLLLILLRFFHYL